MIFALLFVLALLPGPLSHAGTPAASMPGVDANVATAAELDAVNGIGPALAARIIEERRKAPFRSPEDFAKRVRGVGPASLRRMQEGGLVIRPVGGSPATLAGTAASPVAGQQDKPAARRGPPSRP